ncbi:MAG: phosphoribosyl-AMP cyclohydrolase [Alphaproteobacteria bacterium]|nr:phosphoribosyl-AMP cyclohydrolase [Alphaproteobacteria bacterium]
MAENKRRIEKTNDFTPIFDEKGLIPCIAASAQTGEILMLAWMNAEALARTLETGEAHYWSRSRRELWHKGAASGAKQKIIEILTDCDQDCLLLKVEVQGDAEATCHTGRESCFYRALEIQGDAKTVRLKFIDP